MDREDFYLAVKSAKEYAGICDETVFRVIDAVMPKYKTSKQVLKSVKSTLREISAAFLQEHDLHRAKAVLAGVDWRNECDIKQKAATILELHQSARERSAFFAGMLVDIKRETGFESLMDIGCGLFPFAIPHIPCLAGVRYYAMDIHTGAVELANGLFEGLGSENRAFCGDVLINVPEREADCVFMFKLLPLLTRTDKGAPARILSMLNSRCAAVTFPTRSISGRNVGMRTAYDAFVRKVLSGYPVIYEKEYANELLYILQL